MSCGNLLEMQILGSFPDLLNQLFGGQGEGAGIYFTNPPIDSDSF